MRQVWVNELRGLLPHIRQNFIQGTQVYKDQDSGPRVEEEHLRELERRGGGAGRRIGILARTDTGRSPHRAPSA